MGSGCRFLVLWAEDMNCFGVDVRRKLKVKEYFVAEKWVDQVIQINRYNERIIVVKLVVGRRIMNAFSICEKGERARLLQYQ